MFFRLPHIRNLVVECGWYVNTHIAVFLKNKKSIKGVYVSLLQF